MTTCPMCHDPLDQHDTTIVDGREVAECRAIPASSRDTARRWIAQMRDSITRANPTEGPPSSPTPSRYP